MQTTSDNNGKVPEPAPRAFPRWVWLAGAGGMLAIGWLFILITNSFHLTAPVVFVCLGYGAGVAAVYTLFRTGASAVSGDEDAGDDAASWGRPVGARAELEREKRILLKAIKEAEFDLQMGKLSKADAEAMIASYRAQAIEVIKEIDRKEGVEATAREEIEREVRARLEVMKAKKGAEADKRPAGKKADKGKRGGAPAKKGEVAKEAAAKEAKADERILDAAPKAEPAAEAAEAAEADAQAAESGEATEAKAEAAGETAEEKAADAADERAADAAEPKADAAARAAVANDASGAPASAKEATP